ncbi:MAG: serine/threonine protein kinase, partial [Nannocystaceae bacterium]|nr:serine/threonine protein kinase [Nannocystaceae bacterium]
METFTETPFEESSAEAAGPVPGRLGRFALLRELGSGGMGVVYAAYDERLDRKVAIKLLHASATGESEGRARLVREAQAMAKVAHPNVAHVYEVAQQGHRVYVVMQFIDGVDLAAWRERDAPSWTEAARAYLQAGRGLEAAHAAGLVHRDFKPSNVMIDGSGHVRVLDFGIARATDAVTSIVRDEGISPVDTGELRTRTGALVGTPAYLPPEVLRGKKADQRSDQFAFCVSMYETIYGRRPFDDGDAADLIVALLEGKPPKKPESNVPGWVFRVLSRGLRADPAQRYDSMESLLQAIDRGLGGSRPWVALASVGGLLAVGGVAFVLGGNSTTDPCPIDRDALGDAWSLERRGAVRSSITTLEATFAVQAWTRIEARGEAYVEAWVEGMRGACEATRVHGVQSERGFDLRVRCLAERRREFDALTRVLAEADLDTLKKLDGMLSALKPVRVCETPSASLPDDPPPGAEVAVERIRDDLARGAALERAGRDTEGAALVEAILERAEAIEMPSLQPFVAVRVAETLRNTGDYDRPLLLFRRAYFAFIVRGDAAGATRAATDIAELHARREELPAALEWIRHAEASLSSLPDPPPTRRVHLGYSRASVIKKQGDLNEAARVLRDNIEFAEANGVLSHPSTGMLADVLMWQGAWGQALDIYEAGIVDCAGRVGAD